MVNAQATKSSAMKIQIDKWAEIEIMKSEASLETAQVSSESSVLKAESENASVSGFEAIRNHEYNLAKSAVLTELASKSKMVISGNQGDNFIKKLLD